MAALPGVRYPKSWQKLSVVANTALSKQEGTKFWQSRRVVVGMKDGVEVVHEMPGFWFKAIVELFARDGCPDGYFLIRIVVKEADQGTYASQYVGERFQGYYCTATQRITHLVSAWEPAPQHLCSTDRSE